MCEGWSLEIGTAFHGTVVRRDRSGEPPRWIASINSTALGEFLEREIAMHRVEELVEASIVLVLHDWELYQAPKGKDNVRQSAPILRLFGNQNPIEVRTKLGRAEL
jgi:hypothetical protein